MYIPKSNQKPFTFQLGAVLMEPAQPSSPVGFTSHISRKCDTSPSKTLDETPMNTLDMSLLRSQTNGELRSASPFSVLELASQIPLPPSSSTIFTTQSSISTTANESSSIMSRNSSALAPIDRGFGAWSFLLAAFIVEMIVWGFPNAYGVFLDAYLKDPGFSSQPNAQILLPMIGTLTSGIIYCSGVVSYPLIYKYPNHRRKTMWLGALICWASLFGASYTTKFCQGVFYGVGGAMLYNPCIYYMSEWFVVRRGLANGVINAGTATGGLILPLVLPSLIEKYGPSVTLRFLAIVFAVLLLPALPFLRGRLPQARVRGPQARPTMTVSYDGRSRKNGLMNGSFRFFMVANTLQGLGYFVPIVWLPSASLSGTESQVTYSPFPAFATALNLSATNSSLTLALLNGASVVGRLATGMLADVVDPWLLALSTLTGTCLITFVLWGVFSHSLAGLAVFGLAYGSLAGGWSSMWTGFIGRITVDDPQLSTTMIGYLMLSRGIGNIISTPISTAISRPGSGSANSIDLGFEVGGGRFENVIIYAGTCFAGAALMAAIGWGWDRLGSRRHSRH